MGKNESGIRILGRVEMPLSGVEELCQQPNGMLQTTDPSHCDILVFVPKSEQEEMKLGLAASPFVGFV
jgi:hypothetical protein